MHQSSHTRVAAVEGQRSWSDWSASSVTAGFLAVLVSFTGPLAIFYQAAQAAQVDGSMFASWVWGISIGAAVSGIALSWVLRMPVITAWSAPGTALLIALFPNLSLGEAVGAYISAAAILLPFGLNAFGAAGSMPLLAFGMIGAYLVFRRWVPRYSVMLLLVAGSLLSTMLDATHFSRVELHLVAPRFITPAWSWSSTFTLALLGPIVANLAGVIHADDHREAAVITFLATASGMRLLGLGSAFWGIAIGMVAYRVLHAKQLKGQEKQR